MSTVVKLQTPWQKVSGDPGRYNPLLVMQVGVLLAAGLGRGKMTDDEINGVFSLAEEIAASIPALARLPRRERAELNDIAHEYLSGDPAAICDLLDDLRQELAE